MKIATTILGQENASSTLADFCDSVIEQFLTTIPEARGLSEIFANSARVPGYELALDAWFAAWRQQIREDNFRRIDDLSEPIGSVELEEMFFASLRWVDDKSSVLRKYQNSIAHAAQRGDFAFFERMGAELRKSKRNTPRIPLDFTILVHWMPCCLWLATDSAGASFLQIVTGRTVQETAYSKARQRLRLKNYEVAHKKALITGCTKAGAFCYAEGWTNLVPTLSR